ncbi:hypothetical protein ACLB2K_034910 [Fragaria x ananassa]
MEPSLINRFIRLPTAKDVWEAVEKTFYDDSDETRIFELNKDCFAARQNGQPLPTFYNELVGMFQEIDQRIASQNNTVAGVVQETTAIARMVLLQASQMLHHVASQQNRILIQTSRVRFVETWVIASDDAMKSSVTQIGGISQEDPERIKQMLRMP